MMNALDQPQTVLLLGGESDIGRAIVAALASPYLRTVILAGRSTSPLDGVGSAEVVSVRWDATDHAEHRRRLAEIASRYGDLDVVVQAFGQLGRDAAADPSAAAALVDVNTAGAVSSGLAVAEQLRAQGHGVFVVLSSVAGLRTRASNFVYGASKAGQDAFSTGLAAHLEGTGVRVVTVRPGFVRSAMTTGMDDAPFSCDPDDVAAAVVRGIRRDRRVVWVPGVLRVVFGVVRLLPEAVWRRLDR